MGGGYFSRITSSRLKIACDFSDQVGLECIGMSEKRLELVSMHVEEYLITEKVLFQVKKWVLLLQAELTTEELF